jgi:hypothetical protein
MKTNNYLDNSNSIIRLECVIVNQLDEAVKSKVAGSWVEFCGELLRGSSRAASRRQPGAFGSKTRPGGDRDQ